MNEIFITVVFMQHNSLVFRLSIFLLQSREIKGCLQHERQHLQLWN